MLGEDLSISPHYASHQDMATVQELPINKRIGGNLQSFCAFLLREDKQG